MEHFNYPSTDWKILSGGNKSGDMFVDVVHNWFLTEYVHQLKGKEIIIALAVTKTFKGVHLNNFVPQMDRGKEIEKEGWFFVLNLCNWKGSSNKSEQL